MNLNEDGIGKIVQSFAQTVLDPAQWQPAMERLSSAVGAAGCALELTDLHSGTAIMENTIKLDANQLQHYEDRIFHVNPRIARALHMTIGKVADDRELMSQKDYENLEFLDWLETTPYYFTIGGKVLNDNGHVGFLTANFAKNRGMATHDDHLVFSLLTPHLVNFVAAARELSGNQLRNEVATLGSLTAQRPFALLDSQGRLIECSEGFSDILRSRALLDTRNSVLIARHAQHRVTVERFLAVALGPGRYIEQPMPIRLTLPNAPRGLVIRSIPLAPHNNVFDIFRPAVLITLTDLDQPSRVRRNELIALFGLTVREADVAALIGEGQTTQEAAADLRISCDTIRQHLKSVYSKIGVSRQADLVSIISMIS